MNIHHPVPTIYGRDTEKFEELWKAQVSALQTQFGDQIEEVWWPLKQEVEVPVVFFKKEVIVDALRFAKESTELKFNFLSDISATDEQPDPLRFHLFYNLFSHTNLNRIRFKVRVKEGESVPTVVSVWSGANWLEREVFDMFGVRFEGHPDLRRILMDERWEGHPLRKDYPLRRYQFHPVPMEPQEKLLK